MNELAIKDLRATIAEQEIIRGLSLSVPKGEIHAIMGPNGSGKSTLAKVIAGHPDYKVIGGSVTMDGQDILGLAPDERARQGIFLAFQYPNEIPGVTIANFLRAAVQARLPWVDGLPGLPARAEEAAPWLGMIVSYQHPDHDTDVWPPPPAAS